MSFARRVDAGIERGVFSTATKPLSFLATTEPGVGVGAGVGTGVGTGVGVGVGAGVGVGVGVGTGVGVGVGAGLAVAVKLTSLEFVLSTPAVLYAVTTK